MIEDGALGERRPANVQTHAGVAFGSVPVTPVALDLAEPQRQLIHRGLDLLQAEDVRLLAIDERLQLRLSSADAVDIPGCNLHTAASPDATFYHRAYLIARGRDASGRR